MTTTLRSKRTTLIAVTTIATAAVVSAIHAASPTTQPALLPALATSPAPTHKSNLVPVPYVPVMPVAVVQHEPRALKSDASHALRARPALDLPQLALAGGPLPAEAILPAAPAIRVASSDIASLPVGTIAAKADTGRPTVRTDSTAGLMQAGALIVTPPPRSTSPAAQLLSIPDPSHQAGFVPTPAPAMEDAPAGTLDRPGAITLPVTGK